MDFGYIYVMSNCSFPTLFKIGSTAGDPEERKKQLHTTGVPTPFKVEYSKDCDDYQRIEKEIHKDLSKYRVYPQREFFECDIDTIIDSINRLAFRNSDNPSKELLDITNKLKEKHGNMIRKDISRVSIVQSLNRVWLEIVKEKNVNDYLVDEHIHRSDLAFISGCEGDYFSHRDSIVINANKFVNDYDSYSIVHTTDLFTNEACEMICNEHQEQN
ncbi:GIY-YIG nuclease family protein [Vibrio lentus]